MPLIAEQDGPKKDSRSRAPFAVVSERDDMRAELEPVRALVASDPALQPSDARGEQVRADLRTAARSDGTWAIERLYWCVQRADRSAPGGLRARMVVIDPKRGGPAPTVH